jgi:DeoR/GlpR family transcriptional regulator of sugar metabolism
LLKKERQGHILHQVNLHNKILVSDLCVNMRVSEDTIRRDLNELAEIGKIVKIHGGALSVSFQSSLQYTDVYSRDEKRLAALKVLQFIKPGMFILTSGGTTIIELARILPSDLKATFITPSLPAMMEYVRHPNVEAIFIGNKISKTSMISVGGEAVSQLKEIRADLCILGVNAIDAEHGITDNDWEVVQVKRAMIESSKKVYALTIAEKVNTVYRITVCEAERIDTLITDADPYIPLFDSFRKKSVRVI